VIRSRNVLILLTAFLAFFTGCRMEKESVDPPAHRPSVKSDPCADRLHDLSGHLLMYHGLNRRLPAKLEDLEGGMGKLPPLVCPVSKKPYVYTPEGMEIAGRDEIMIVHDPEPSHSGMRWAILVAPPESGKALTTRVIMLTERAITTAKKLSDSNRADAGKEKK
jgi:hypothetical protein